MSSGDAPIVGYVEPPPAKKKPGPRKGWKKRTEAAALSPARPGACVGCGADSAGVGLDMVRELVRLARDQASEEAKLAKPTLLYLSARLDGFCSLACWRLHAPEELVDRVDSR